MTYFLHDGFESTEGYSPGCGSVATTKRAATEREGVHVLREKLKIPSVRGAVERRRVEDVLRKSLTQFPATLVSGRAGTGKTTAAAGLAQTYEHAAWYSVESADFEWNVFAHYFASSVLEAVNSQVTVADVLPDEIHASQSAIATFLINLFAEAETELLHEPLLIVLDGIHHLFDAEWFGEFFSLLLSSLPENANLLLLCRSKPPSPLWRLRSKQQLNVIDEKLLAFNLAETVELLKQTGGSRSDAERAHAATFGRIAKLLQTVRR
ncbi:MAG TPA: AAA family ATPase [Pyrinomonadaceae bacterium]|nr:AAA family ATPase [Pyrinomonadaceae bacterium]